MPPQEAGAARLRQDEAVEAVPRHGAKSWGRSEAAGCGHGSAPCQGAEAEAALPGGTQIPSSPQNQPWAPPPPVLLQLPAAELANSGCLEALSHKKREFLGCCWRWV